jgi:hypothetical protein
LLAEAPKVRLVAVGATSELNASNRIWLNASRRLEDFAREAVGEFPMVQDFSPAL